MGRLIRNLSSLTLASTLALAFTLAADPFQARAVTGYDSAYSGETAFMNAAPGQTVNFQVFFTNTGTTTWTRNTGTQVDLAACLADKTSCNLQDASEAAWNAGWLSAVRYATTTQTTVAPGSVATFSYNVRAPDNVLAGTYRFNGDLVLASTGERIHPEGYFQDATVLAIGGPGGVPGPPGSQGPPGPPGSQGPPGRPFQPCNTEAGSTDTTYEGGEGAVVGEGTATAPANCVVNDVSASWVNMETGSSGTLVCTANDSAFNGPTEPFMCDGEVAGVGTHTILILTVGSYSNGTESVEPDALPEDEPEEDQID
jgi:hypothetical protein